MVVGEPERFLARRVARICGRQPLVQRDRPAEILERAPPVTGCAAGVAEPVDHRPEVSLELRIVRLGRGQCLIYRDCLPVALQRPRSVAAMLLDVADLGVGHGEAALHPKIVRMGRRQLLVDGQRFPIVVQCAAWVAQIADHGLAPQRVTEQVIAVREMNGGFRIAGLRSAHGLEQGDRPPHGVRRRTGVAGHEQHSGDVLLGAGGIASRSLVVAWPAAEQSGDREGPAVALQRPRRVPQARAIRGVLHLPHLEIRLRQVRLQGTIPRRFPGEAVEILQRLLHDELARGRRAGQVLDGVVQLEQQGVRQVTHVLEAALGHLRFMRGHHDADDQRARDRRRRCDRRLVPPDELRGAVAQGRRPGHHRQALQVPPHVLGQLLGRGIAPLRLLAQCHQDDVVEVAAQAPAQLLRVPLACVADRARQERVEHAPVGDGDSFHPGDCGTGLLRLELAHDLLHLERAAALQVIGQAPGEQLVEHHAQGVDVGRGRERLPADLLGTRVVGRHRAQLRQRELQGLRPTLRVQ